MKTIIALTLLSLCARPMARGVLIQCWEKGDTQERIIYQNDGGYIHHNYVFFDGQYEEIRKSDDGCLSWDFPKKCKEVVFRENGDEISLEVDVKFSTPTFEALEGHLYEVEITEVFCKRKAL